MTEPVPPLHLDIALLQQAYRGLLTIARRVAGRHGLSPNEVALLGLMRAAGGPISPSQVSPALGLSLQGITALTDRLHDKGYLERALSTVDRRKRELTLTERGRRQAEVVTAVLSEAIEAALGGDERQRARLRDSLTDLCHRLPAAGRGVAVLRELGVQKPSVGSRRSQ